MPEIKRASIERRSGEDRRAAYDLDYFRWGGKERRKGKDRRSQGERRSNWVRVSKWSSVNIPDLQTVRKIHEEKL